MKVSLLLASFVVSCVTATKYITVSDSECGGSVNIDDEGSVVLYYYGPRLDSTPCKFEIETDKWDKKVCVSANNFDIACNTKVLYNGGYYSEMFPDKEFDCNTKQYSEWCTTSQTLFVAFVEDTGSSRSGNVELTVTTRDSYVSNIVESAVTTVYVIIGVIVGAIILITIIVIVVVCCVCNRRRRAAGTVYRTPQQATAVTGNYPVQATPQGYQPPPQGYQPPPQGYQPPPQGYQPPPQGYQPPPQGYGPGYQPPPQGYAAGYPPGQPATHPPPEKTMASAPPAGDFQMASMEPPPYPGK